MIDVLGNPIGIGDYVFGTVYTGKESASVWMITGETKLMWQVNAISTYSGSNRMHKNYSLCIKLTPEQVIVAIRRLYAQPHADKCLKEFKLI